MKVIGLTGPSGVGKGWVCQYLSQFNIPSIDTDAVYHKLLVPPSPCLNELVTTFGQQILSNGNLNRAALATIVFSDPQKLKQLNTITHKYILARTDVLLSTYREKGHPAAIVDAPALFESGYNVNCDFVITVLADKELRLKRIIKRDGISAQAAEKRLNAQKPDEFYSSRAKYTVVNNGDDTTLNQELLSILTKEGLANC